jgi:thiol-disulfide isomerase/thioredoxin
VNAIPESPTRAPRESTPADKIARLRHQPDDSMRTLLLLILCCCTGLAWAKGPVLGQPAPALEGTDLEGRNFSLAADTGKVVIVHFWASWCAPCRQEMPVIDAFYRKHKSEGVEVIAVSLDDAQDVKLVNTAMATFSFPAALISQTKAKGYGRLWRIPLTFVIDRHGILRRDGWTAAPDIDAATLDAAVLPLLADR